MMQQYHAEMERLIQYGGSRNESVLRKVFQELLDRYARSRNLMLIPELEYLTPRGYRVVPDGTLKDALRQDWGFWESKDEKDNLDDEIKTKFAKGYPSFNILFEDKQTAVLFQDGVCVLRASFDDDADMDELLTLFVNYEPREVREFHKAIELFTADVPNLAESLREIIEEQFVKNAVFREKVEAFLELCRKAINPNVVMADIREMIIQHILTEDIFIKVFDEAEFHRENVIAKNLQELVLTFYTDTSKRNTYNRIAHYYETINAKAAQISNHHEKQKFLKALYESFYRAYNPKAADRLGVIYTPDEIVRFMVEGTDYLLNKHFQKTLGEPYVEILDPATGTGTFITEIIEYLPLSQLESKYDNEIHCNEVSILPYYIANLNIEYTYKQKVGMFKEFENICFVDTLDNVGFSRNHTHQMDFFGIWDENAERIGRQNTRKISVIIGNPPYNANQLNENENNKNREYPEIDKRIKETYIAESTAQKTKLYDMYARFLRWASDRINQNGIIAFVSNNSFLDARSFDGFRKVVAQEFSDIYILNMKGDARTSGERRRKEGGNVFSDQIRVGVAIYFLVKKKENRGCQIHYQEVDDYMTAVEKQKFLINNKVANLKYRRIIPSKRNNWLNQPENSWDDLIAVASKAAKASQRVNNKNVIFKLFSLGVVTARDEWVHDHAKDCLRKKIAFFIREYNRNVDEYYGKVTKDDVADKVSQTIKWTRAVKRDIVNGKRYRVNSKNFIETLYRPYFKQNLYFSRDLNEMQYQLPKIFKGQNIVITFSGTSSAKKFATLVTNKVYSYDLIEKTQCLPLYFYDDAGKRIENITAKGLSCFQSKYDDKSISRLNVFHYVYAVFHNPSYRDKYEINLKLDLPRVPLFEDFWQWANWGKLLMDFHLNYEDVEKYTLKRVDIDPEKTRKAIVPKLKADKERGIIEIDTLTTLSGIPSEVWDYQLGTYSAMEWILERYKEKTPRDPTIRDKFNTYKFSDYKEQVIDLLMRVCTVSVETMRIVKEMEEMGEG